MAETAPQPPKPDPQTIIDELRNQQPGPVEELTDLGEGSYDLTVGKLLMAAELPPDGAGKK